MKNTVKLFEAIRSIALIVLIALIGLAACDNGNDPDTTNHNPGGDITWSAQVNGTADTDDTTRITLTFSEAVAGLTANDITLTDGTGSVTKGSLSGSGKGYVLNITVDTAGTVSVKVTKDGVTTAAQDVTVHKAGGITWSAAADGTLSTADSAKITFTFSEAVAGLTANDITLTPLTVSVDKGALSGSGTSYTLNITVINQGYINAAIAKGGVTKAAQQVQVFKQAVNPISADVKTYIDGGEQVVFSAPSGSGGTYTLNSFKKDDDGDFVYDEDNHYTWEPKAEGAYSWDSSEQTLTLTPEKVADDDGAMTAKANALPLFVGWMRGEIDKEIEDRLKWSGETQAAAEVAVLAARNEENETNYATLNALINALADIRFNEMFTAHSYTYTFSNDGESLILLEALPEPVGTDELAGETYNGTISDWVTGQSSRDSGHKFVFSTAGKTYTETGSDGSELSTGYYSYNSNSNPKQVYLKQTTRNGKTPEEFYDTTDYYDDFDRLPEADSRASQTYQHFKLLQHDYVPASNIIDTKDSGEVEGQ
jgi:hypothetical protein